MDSKIAFSCADLSVTIDQRRSEQAGESRGITAKRDLARYYALLRNALAEIELSIDEWSLLVDVCNGWEVDPIMSDIGLGLQVRDAITLDHADDNWGVDGDALTRKISEISPLGHLAIVDIAQQYWASVADGESPSIGDVVKKNR